MNFLRDLEEDEFQGYSNLVIMNQILTNLTDTFPERNILISEDIGNVFEWKIIQDFFEESFY